jgi:hypothetical protein
VGSKGYFVAKQKERIRGVLCVVASLVDRPDGKVRLALEDAEALDFQFLDSNEAGLTTRPLR